VRLKRRAAAAIDPATVVIVAIAYPLTGRIDLELA
jgi:hypothetical protein